MTPYNQFISHFAKVVQDAKSLPLGGFAPLPRPSLKPDAPRVLIFSPHPDDECVIGGLALRLMRESGFRAVNVAVTQGSDKVRQSARWAELKAACDFIGFDLVATAPGGLEKITLKAREQEREHWSRCVPVIADILAAQKPRVILFPHERDWNGTHIGTHHLVMDALKTLPSSFECFCVETEFWGQMSDPNLMVESGAQDLADLMAALSFHVGEVKRNPYHVTVPAWMMDNVRRAEVVGGQGSAAPGFTFATNYRLRKWSNGALSAIFSGGKFLSKSKNPASLFA
jgi:LmbE family N-acetylglucosaminyl deacetylase